MLSFSRLSMIVAHCPSSFRSRSDQLVTAAFGESTGRVAETKSSRGGRTKIEGVGIAEEFLLCPLLQCRGLF